MALDVPKLAADMLDAAKGPLAQGWSEVHEYAATEFKQLAETLAMIERLKAANAITDEQARLHLEIQKNATRTVLLTIEGLGLLAVEQAINAALGVVRGAVNTALGFALV